MGPGALAQVLRPLADLFPLEAYPGLLRGLDVPDDAAVWKLDADRALVLTVDFFPPVVDDPYAYGAIAAANSLSDIYAMGGEPILGLNIAGFPEDLETSTISEILRGGGEKMREAGAVIAGGHTTTDEEPKYGLAVLGMVHPDRLWSKRGALPEDLLYLTKPIGTGVITTAHKRAVVHEGHLEAAVASMARLNAGAARLLRRFSDGVHAATDVTGFALVGHAHELAQASGASIVLDSAALPLLPGAVDYARDGCIAGGGRRNREHYEPWVRRGPDVRGLIDELMHDPQTSGGLLVAVAPALAAEIEAQFAQSREPLWRVGRVCAGNSGTVEIH